MFIGLFVFKILIKTPQINTAQCVSAKSAAIDFQYDTFLLSQMQELQWCLPNTWKQHFSYHNHNKLFYFLCPG